MIMPNDGAVIYSVQGDNSQFNADMNKSKTLATASAVAIGTAFVDMSKRVASAIGTAISTGMTYNAQIETYQTSFETMLGSAEKASTLMEELKRKAAETPFELSELTEVTQLLMNYGFTADEVTEKMSMLGDISQGNSDKMMRVAAAYGQMSSAGKVSLEDIKQMIEAGFNPLQEITESTGESMASLYDRISKGTISVDEITDAMKRSTSEGGKYFQAMQKQSKTLSGQMSTLKDNTNSFLGALTAGLFDVAKNNVLPKLNREMEKLTKNAQSGSLKKSIDKMADSFDELASEAIDFAVDIIPSLIDGLSWVMDNFDILTGIVKTAVASFLAFKTANTIVPIIMGMVTAFQTAQVQLALFSASNGAAALSSAALTAQLTLSEIVTGVLTGKISLATAAQWLWNTAIAANPVMAIIVGITALTAALVGLSLALKDGVGEAGKMAHELQKDREEFDELSDSMQETRKKFKENTRSIEDNAAVAKKLADRLFALDKQTNKNVSTKKEMSEIVAQLNEIYPDLKLNYDEETDSLNMNSQALTENLEAQKAQFLMNDDIEKRNELWLEEERIKEELTERQEKLTEAQKAYDEAIEGVDLEEARRTHDAMLNTIGQLSDNLRTAKENVTDYENALKQNAEDQEEINASIDEHSSHIDGLAESTENAADETERLIVGNYDMTEALAATGISAEEAQEKYDTYAENTQNAFDKIKDTVKLTADDMINNLNSNQERVSKWTTNLGILADKGLDSGLLQALRDLGPEAAVTVQNLANTSSEKLKLLNEAYRNGGDLAAQALLDELGAPAVVNSGGDTIEQVADSMTDNTVLTDRAAKNIVVKLKSTMKSAVEFSNFPSLGKAICQGMANGITSNRYLVEAAARRAAEAAERAARKALDSHSPSKVFTKIGQTAPQGLAKGIEKDTKMAETATKKMVDRTINLVTPQNIVTPIANTSPASISPMPLQINLTGNVDVDGFTLGKIMLRNLDDAAAFTLRG